MKQKSIGTLIQLLGAVLSGLLSFWFFFAFTIHHYSIPVGVPPVVQKAGQLTAEKLITYWGIVAYTLPLYLMVFIFFFFVDIRKEIDRCGALLIFVLSNTALIQLLSFGNGGKIGSWLLTFLNTYIDAPLTYLFLFVIWLSSCMVLTRLACFFLVGQLSLFIYSWVHLLIRYFSFIRVQTHSSNSLHFTEEKQEDDEQLSTSAQPTALPSPLKKRVPITHYSFPSKKIFRIERDKKIGIDNNVLRDRARLLEEKLFCFGIKGSVVSIKYGPVVTLFEYVPDITVKVSKILAFEDDLALALRAVTVRIIAPIPGQSAVGFEVANDVRQSVFFGAILENEAQCKE